MDSDSWGGMCSSVLSAPVVFAGLAAMCLAAGWYIASSHSAAGGSDWHLPQSSLKREDSAGIPEMTHSDF